MIVVFRRIIVKPDIFHSSMKYYLIFNSLYTAFFALSYVTFVNKPFVNCIIQKKECGHILRILISSKRWESYAELSEFRNVQA